MPKRSNETITLGSGKLFVKEYLDEIPAVAEIAVSYTHLRAHET